MDEMMKKVEELSQNEEFKARIAQLESAEEIAAAFQAEGVKVTAEDLQTALAAQQSGELSEDSLEGVSGGFAATTIALAGLVVTCFWKGFDYGWQTAKDRKK
jgi:predicted ribosomally synthesized peptide with nif11-like leader